MSGRDRRGGARLSNDPLWYKDAVIYQLHVKSFFDSDNDGIGDFPGLIAKLDYIAELGVDAVWLLPFYPSPRRDDGYDIADYRGVHPDYGTMTDVRRLIAAAHARGIRVITELVINHTSDQHPWFQRARVAKPGSTARNYYVWSDTDQAYSGTRIIFLDTEKSNWTWDPVAGAYFWHRFYSHQPDLNFDNPRVMAEVTRVMKYWLDVGVDGLRLDAVPYLIEREGTNNENLPETHAVLKRIRQALDRHAPGRMLLAEANQWPEDAQQYFGDGDECHMSFHFPLMPRMYMAIAQEDRFPITDIMRQTPDIPAECQWAIFLRNHDELTLEMVTDKERDYLWQTYAADRRARLNLGIRRRLAPLLEHDRRRIELMNGLLLSMPGTPVIYYGDEIGMGDNIHLGDRDGVRTPMQWSPDRNGGFSRANPASLVSPPIMDALYGYDAVNVEAQAADPHSLLNWTRRMLAVRRRHRAFGRGKLRFLYPGNRKVLAYLREHEEETILCICNLSRTSQAVELDLSSFAGRIPVDAIGGSAFPPVGQLTYLITLPPFGFYWFLLATDAALPPWHLPASEALPELDTLVMRNGLADVLEGASLRMIETDVLPDYLSRRRWFAAKDQTLSGTQVVLAMAIADDLALAEVEARTEAGVERYQLPLGLAWEDETGAALVQQLALARVRKGRRIGWLTDAFALDALPLRVLRAMRDGVRRPIGDGELRAVPTEALRELDIPDDAEIRRLSAEQSNSSLIVGDQAVLKVVRRVVAGISPEVEMTRVLTERGFANTAPLLGEVVRVDAEGVPHTLLIAQGFVRNQGDGWTWTQDFLARVADEASVADAPATVEHDLFGSYGVFAAAIGRRLAEMHAVLAQPSDDPAFAPRMATEDDARIWVDRVEAQIQAAAAAASAVSEWPSPSSVEAAERLRAFADICRPKLAALAHGDVPMMRIHGDFHLGQVLVTQGDAMIIDFEGEPAKPLEERRSLSSPLRDVAGLLRSIDYATAVARPGRTAASEAAETRRSAMLNRFRADASASFLTAYEMVAGAMEGNLLRLFLIEKAAYEICYEAASRPGWIGIPLRALDALIGEIAEPGEL